MSRRKRENIDYRVAQAIEVITRKSTEFEEAHHSIRHYAQHLGTGERNLYKLINRAVNIGFKFGISLKYDRLTMARIIGIVDGKLDFGLPVEGEYISMEGMRIYDLLAAGKCIDEVVNMIEAMGGTYYIVTTEWASRPALATVKFLYAHPAESIDDSVFSEMSRLLRDVLARGPPNVIYGRRYPLDKSLMAIIASARRRAIVDSVAQMARDLGIGHAKAQRKYYNLWNRRIVLGYSVVDAPYFTKDKVIAVIKYNDPMRMAYAAAVLPPVVSGLVVSDNLKKKPEKVLLILSGSGNTITRTLSIIRQNWGKITKLIYYHEEKIDPNYPKEIISMSDEDLKCKR